MTKTTIPSKIKIAEKVNAAKDLPKDLDQPPAQVEDVMALVEEMKTQNALLGAQNQKLLNEIESLNRQLNEAPEERVRVHDKDNGKWKKDLIEVTFLNNESPGTECQFVFEGMAFTLQHGYKYEIPKRVAKHLNQLAVPVWQEIYNEKTGQYEIQQIGLNPRFVCSATGSFD